MKFLGQDLQLLSKTTIPIDNKGTGNIVEFKVNGVSKSYIDANGKFVGHIDYSNIDGVPTGVAIHDHDDRYTRKIVGTYSSGDMNSILATGEYNIATGSSGMTNAPYAGNLYGKLRVYVNDGGVHNNIDNWIWQYFDDTSGNQYYRYKVNNGTWQSWVVIYNGRNFDPASKSDIGHTHTGVYAPVHNHPYAPDTHPNAVASISLGHVKSGTDITVDASGNVSVNDNSHNHLWSNITDRPSSLPANGGNADTVGGVPVNNIVYGNNATATNGVNDLNTLYKSQFFDVYNGANAPTTGWLWGLNISHSGDNANYRYGGQITIGNGDERMHFRGTSADGTGTWRELWHNGNFNPANYASVSHNHNGIYEPSNSNIQTHISSAHAPSNAQPNQTVISGGGMNFTTTSGDVTIAMGTPSTLTSNTTNSVSGITHSHAISLTASDVGASPSGHNHDGVYIKGVVSLTAPSSPVTNLIWIDIN